MTDTEIDKYIFAKEIFLGNISKKHQKKYLEILRKRRDYLVLRVASSGKDLSYDKAEAAALSWAISKLQEVIEQ